MSYIGGLLVLIITLGVQLFPLAQLSAQPSTSTPVTPFTTLVTGPSGRLGLKTVDLTPSQFLGGVKKGPRRLIWGELHLPPVATWGEIHIPNEYLERRPAVILVQGEDEVGTREARWAAMLNELGVPTFVLDSFTGRGVSRPYESRGTPSQEAMIVDAYRALALLSTHPRLDPTRIALMGFSRGGSVALYASLTRFHRLHGSADIAFAAYLAFYPVCNTTYLDDDHVGRGPIRILHGTADNVAPLASCRAFIDRLRATGQDIQLLEYQDAHHQFDVPDLPAAQDVPDFPNRSRCLYVERWRGQLVDGTTEQPPAAQESCLWRGGTIGYNPAAHRQAVEAVKEVLTVTFKLYR